MNMEHFITTALTSRGAGPIRAKDLVLLDSGLRKRGFWVTRLEAHERRGEREIATLDFAVIGLDGPENWENHHDVDRHSRLVRSWIEAAQSSGLQIEFRVWIEPRD